MSNFRPFPAGLSLAIVCLVCAPAVQGWDYTGHRIINTAALGALPPDFPGFVHEAAATGRIAFLAGEPDRWRNAPDLPIRHVNGSDHYLDLEQVPQAGLEVATLTSFRYDFVTAFAAGRAAHPQNFPAIDPAKNSDHSREWPGFAPWAIAENYGRLKSACSYLRTFREFGTPEEVRNAQDNIIYLMGILGHLVGDLAQPLHTTNSHNGWVGPNPHGYTRWTGIHQWVDGGLIGQVGIGVDDVKAKVATARPLPVEPRADGRDPLFVAVMDYLIAQNAKVEPLYRLEKAGQLGPQATDLTPGRAFIEQQLATGAGMLSCVWLTAWRTSTTDSYLENQLRKRQGLSPAK